jgi:hypothetical protein
VCVKLVQGTVPRAEDASNVGYANGYTCSSDNARRGNRIDAVKMLSATSRMAGIQLAKALRI